MATDHGEKKARCEICPHRCRIEEGQTGFCGARVCRDGRVTCALYGRVTSLALDPVEKKPLARFHPGAAILSVGSYGCSLRCPFCQNAEISRPPPGGAPCRECSPEQIAALAGELAPQGNIGVAYTYNEPLVGFEFVLDCARLVRERGMKNVLVTNGMILPGPFEQLWPLVDAANIDLKAFDRDFYRWVGGDLDAVLRTIRASAAACHTEVTTLVIPGKNDSPEMMDAEAEWLASIDPAIPLHITRFFPRHLCRDIPPTPLETLAGLKAVAERRLKYVFLGNC